ncbi:TolC family protein [Rhodohalobacter halophilus]|uniref:TolC family protein n=1 Tax=Rhodohalobacter halophilus TaxID=1812810 RepID=UPI0009FF9F5F|nr:TolC family protein [Rhodohalobacter halophilus]
MNSINSYVLKLCLFAGLLLMPSILMAQSSMADKQELSISLQEAMELALEQNFSIEQAEHDVEATRAQYRQTNAVFLPQLSFEYNAISTNDPLNVFAFKLKQEVVSQQDFNPALLNDPDAYENYSAKFEVRQPLFNPDMMMQRGAVKSQLNSVNEQLQGTKNHIRYQVRNQYYSLILHIRQLDVLESALQTAGEHRRQAQNFFEEGLLSKEDFLAARVYELELESRKINSENELNSVREEIALLLGLDGSVTISPTEDLYGIDDASITTDVTQIRVNNAQTRAIEQRVKAAERMTKSATFSFLPKINLFGSYEYNDPDFASFSANSYMIGANLRWNIFSGFSQAGKVQEARANYNKARSMQESHRFEMENQVRRAYRSLEHAEKELELTEEAIKQSSEDVKIRSNRFKEGMARTTDLLEAETKLAEAKLKNVMALYKYNMSIAALEMLLEQDFTNQ